eukprot:1742464-Pyramimonas_sp.AAC.1
MAPAKVSRALFQSGGLQRGAREARLERDRLGAGARWDSRARGLRELRLGIAAGKDICKASPFQLAGMRALK